VSSGTNILVGDDRGKLTAELDAIMQGKQKKGVTPPLWDGRAGGRIADVLQRM
jgi:UDP-N-acetylglucosamine 2-epimerase (non-hydrolysing)